MSTAGGDGGGGSGGAGGDDSGGSGAQDRGAYGGERAADSAIPGTDESMSHASWWWYIDASGTEQGPFESSTMRSWLLAQYLPCNTRVAPSYGGEVPTDFVPIQAIWRDPGQQAFVSSTPTADAQHGSGQVQTQLQHSGGGSSGDEACSDEDGAYEQAKLVDGRYVDLDPSRSLSSTSISRAVFLRILAQLS
eukprot:1443380-Pleurochrysis_carterae.AAC.2